MVNNLPITLLGKAENIDDLDTSVKIINLDFDILGESLHFRIATLNKLAKLSDIVPAARVISDKITKVRQKAISSKDGAIPCRKGCALCCHYLVLVSPPEAFRLLEEIKHLPIKACGDLIEGCSRTAKSVQKYLSEHISPIDTYATLNQQEEFANWYFTQKKPCSFLHQNSCSIYEKRPVICREYFVANSASPCISEDPNKEGILDVPISIRQALKNLTSSLTLTIPESIVLPCVFDWYKHNLELSNRTWPAVTIVNQFVKIVKAMGAKKFKNNGMKLKAQ